MSVLFAVREAQLTELPSLGQLRAQYPTHRRVPAAALLGAIAQIVRDVDPRAALLVVVLEPGRERSIGVLTPELGPGTPIQLRQLPIAAQRRIHELLAALQWDSLIRVPGTRPAKAGSDARIAVCSIERLLLEASIVERRQSTLI